MLCAVCQYHFIHKHARKRKRPRFGINLSVNHFNKLRHSVGRSGLVIGFETRFHGRSAVYTCLMYITSVESKHPTPVVVRKFEEGGCWLVRHPRHLTNVQKPSCCFQTGC
ncbi:hypothetical protein AVEN_108052-1 [Araneus ventricosus]|uniref:Uncharacterized protein n=1 Tax=Araneus ventricosus TaxID=182803 RepID=A0A4Y2PKI7_ARAVE|nr:hypothetical protein AVEN_108052-1 [Araneus ventricosus]